MSEPRRRIPMRALFWKEWRQLRLVRLVVGAACAFVPALLLVAAEGSSLMGLREYDLRGVVVDAVPIVLAGAWTLFSLFVTVQAFLGDRAAGVELFLLTMPVRRRWVFVSRLAASAGTSATIVLVSIAAWLSWVLAMVGPGALPGERTAIWLTRGGFGILFALASGTGAAILVSLPLAAVLVGAVLGAAPVVLAVKMGRYAAHGYWVGLFFALLLFPAFVAVSYGTFCFGEPAGRGRYRRAATWLSGALALIGVLFASSASYVSRDGLYRFGSPQGSASHPLTYFQLADPPRQGWLVDTSSERVLRHFPRVRLDASWSPDGRYLAVASGSAAPGNVEIFDAERSESRSVPIEDPRFKCITSITWTRTHLVLESCSGSSIAAVSLEGWTVSVPPLPILESQERLSALVTPGGEPYLAIEIGDGQSRGRSIGLYRLHIETGAVDPAPAFELELPRPVRDLTPGLAANAWLEVELAWRASPSGRFWVTEGPKGGELSLLDTETSARIWIESLSPQNCWLAGDTLFWVVHRRTEGRSILRAWDAVRGARDLGAVAYSYSLRLVPSPDLRKVLVFDTRPSDVAAQVLDLASATWFDLAGACPEDARARREPRAWAAPDVLVCRDAKRAATFHHLEPRRSELATE